MDQYLESVSIDKIKDLRNKIELRNKNGGVSSPEADSGEYGSLDEDNWEFLMIHTSKRVEETLEIQH
jgi:hypothetical protein